MLIASKFGAKDYIVYVNFLLFSNFVFALSSLGISNRLMILDKSCGVDRGVFISVGLVNIALIITLVCVVAFFWVGALQRLNMGESNAIFLLIAFYVFAYYLLSCGTSLLCTVAKYESAGLMWFITYLTAAVFLIIAIESGSSFYGSWAIFCCIIFFLAILFFNSLLGLKELWRGFLSLRVLNFLEVGVSGFFSIVLLLGFYVVNNAALGLGNVEEAASFSFGMQFFGLLIFIPGVMGGVLLPSISKLSKEDGRQHLIKFIFVYFLLAVFGVFALLVIFNSVGYFNDLYERYSVVANYFLLASIVAAMCAAFNQYFFALRRFGLMAIVSIAWLFFNLLSIFFCGSIFDLAVGFALSYLFMFFMYVLIFLKGT